MPENRVLVVITGYSGFLGSNLAQELNRKRIPVLGIDKRSRSERRAGHFSFLEADLLSGAGLGKIRRRLKHFRNTAIYLAHLAGLADVRECRRYPRLAYAVNVKSLMNICEVLKEHSLKNIVLSSTALVYGLNYRGLIRENFLPQPQDVYARTKLKAEDYLLNYGSINKVRTTILRLSNVYGSGMADNTLISEVHRQLNNGALHLKEYCGIRDYLYFQDAIKAFRLSLFNAGKSAIYNVGTSRGYSVLSLVKIIAELLGKKELIPKVNDAGARTTNLVLSHSKIRRDLDWEPEYNLREGLEATLC